MPWQSRPASFAAADGGLRIAAYDSRVSGDLRLLRALFATAVAVSVVHYADNVIAYDAYPDPVSGPDPSRGLIAAAWFVLTPIGFWGYRAYRRGRERTGAIALAVYSASGLVGIGHYTVDGATAMPLLRQAHIVADIACGAALAAFAMWTALKSRDARDGPTAHA